MGSMICDVYRSVYRTDIALVNAGAIRTDRIIGVDNLQGAQHPTRAFPLKIGDIMDMIPFSGILRIKETPGAELKETVEIAVSGDRPNGRFLQCSGIYFRADRTRPRGARVSKIESIEVIEHSVNQHLPSEFSSIMPQNRYTVVMPSFLAQDYAGYRLL